MSDTSDRHADEEKEIASAFVNQETLFPDWNGAVPLYPDHPPDTVLPILRCPCCGEMAPTMKDLWRLYKHRERLIDERNELEYPSEEWSAYQEGVKETNRKISRISGALPTEYSSWVRRQIEPFQWSNSDLNPANYRSVDTGTDHDE